VQTSSLLWENEKPMPVRRSTTRRSPLPDGTVVTTTVREGTRRRSGPIAGYVLGAEKSYSTTSTRTHHPDGTVVTTTSDNTNVVGILVLVLLLAAVGGIISLFHHGQVRHLNGNGHPRPVAGPPAPPAGFTVLLYSLKAETELYYGGQFRLVGGPVVVCYDAPPGPMGVSISLYFGDNPPDDPQVNLNNPGRACTQWASSAEVRQLMAGNPNPIDVDDTGQPFMVNVWERAPT
jgi:hypothetical protein